jgi:Lysozyme like domain
VFSYYGLEQLWLAAGGAPGEQGVAACIAEHESGGYIYATGRAGERGLWQIMPSWGALSSYYPAENAYAAVVISHDGTNWGPWTTAPDCGV